jgi:hypothetical protein
MVKAKGSTTYIEVADTLVEEFLSDPARKDMSDFDQAYDDKNIRFFAIRQFPFSLPQNKWFLLLVLALFDFKESVDPLSWLVLALFDFSCLVLHGRFFFLSFPSVKGVECTTR